MADVYGRRMAVPLIVPHGSTVIVYDGAKKSTHRCFSPEEALVLAGELEEEAFAEQRKRDALLASYIADGVDVVMPHPDDMPVVIEDAPVDPGTVLNPAASIAVPPAEEPEPVPVTVPEPVDEEPAVDAPLPAVVAVSWDPDSGKVIADVTPTADATLWRTVGRKSSTFKIEDGKPSQRRWSGAVGDQVVIRVGDENGPVVADVVVTEWGEDA